MQNSDGCFVPDTDVSDAQQQQVDPDGVSKIDETDFDEQSGDTSKVTGESMLEDTKDEQSGDTTVNPDEADADKDTENLKKDSDDAKQKHPKLVTLKPVENNVLGKKNSDLSMHSRETLMVNGDTGRENKVTIMVHSDVKGVVGSITKKFREYTGRAWLIRTRLIRSST